ncbi:hypothetical protein GY45DRAFT_1338861 [Cubamyces sp. BRFM 1775]|nr:hypothetical protein GY45DRAFT_1338861 [Cubamyces sp. BRFM 1775]
MTWLQLVRLGTLGFTFLCGTIVLLNASYLALASPFLFLFNSERFNIVVGVLTALSTLMMIMVDTFRTGAFTSMVIVELSWLSFLWVLWLASTIIFGKYESILAYIITLLVVALINGARGSRMWLSSVKEMPRIVPLSTTYTQTSMAPPTQIPYQQQPTRPQPPISITLPTANVPPSTAAATAPSMRSRYPQV